MPYLEIEYLPSIKWAHALRAEIAEKPALAAADLNWGTSDLLDLAFGLETRWGNLAEIVVQVNESLRGLDAEFHEASDYIATLVAERRAYRIKDHAALRRTIIGPNSFVLEARRYFENLARFYQQFLRNYFNKRVSKEDAYAKVGESVAAPGWAEDLRLLRHEIAHVRSPWIRFDIRPGAPKYQPVLLLEYRPMATSSPGDEVSLDSLESMRTHLWTASEQIRSELIERVRSL
jgi:hypothetical protein